MHARDLPCLTCFIACLLYVLLLALYVAPALFVRVTDITDASLENFPRDSQLATCTRKRWMLAQLIMIIMMPLQ